MTFSKFNFIATGIKRVALSTLLLTTVAVSSCELRSEDPLTPEVEAFVVVDRPAVPCGSSVFKSLVEPNLTPYGSVELVNDAFYDYVIVSCDHDWGVMNFQVFAGELTNIPTMNSQMQHEAFPYKMMFAQPENQVSYKIPVNSLPNCATIVVRAKIAKMDLFGNILQTKIVWMNGANLLNGFRADFCRTICLPPPPNMVSSVN